MRRGEAGALEFRWNRHTGVNDRIIRVGVDAAGRVLAVAVWRSPYRPTMQRYRARQLEALEKALDGTKVQFVRWLPSPEQDDEPGPVSLILDRGRRAIIHPKHFGPGDLECGC